jgi:hypothetical protein
MFNNIGKKIKKLVKFETIVCCILFIIFAIRLFTQRMVFLGFVVLIFGCLLSWISSFLLYGFGELIDKTAEIAKNTTEIAQNTKMGLRLTALENSKDEENESLEMAEKIKSSVLDEMYEENLEAMHKENSDKMFKEEVDESYLFDPENIPKENECPCCFHEISEFLPTCPYCGHKLK